MKSNHKQTAVKLTASKIGTHVMVQLVTEYGKQCLHQVVFQLYLHVYNPGPCQAFRLNAHCFVGLVGNVEGN